MVQYKVVEGSKIVALRSAWKLKKKSQVLTVVRLTEEVDGWPLSIYVTGHGSETPYILQEGFMEVTPEVYKKLK